MGAELLPPGAAVSGEDLEGTYMAATSTGKEEEAAATTLTDSSESGSKRSRSERFQCKNASKWLLNQLT